MAQGRMLTRASSEDDSLNRCSLEGHLLYVQTIPHLDRDGLITGRPLLLWRLALPLRVDFIDITGRLIEEWVQHGLVIRYPGKDGPVLFFKGFRRHNQNIPYEHEAPSVHPPPPGWLRTPVGLIPEDAEQRALLAESFDARSSYRKMLLDPGRAEQMGKSRPGRDDIARRSRLAGDSVARPSRRHREDIASDSRPGRDLLANQDQDQTEDQDQCGGGGDQSNTTLRVDEGEGLGEGGGHGLHPLQFSEAALRRAAVEIGPVVFGSEFRGYGSYVAGADAQTLAGLLSWIGYFWDRMDRTDGIRELPAYIRGCLNKGDWPALTTKESQQLIELIVQAQEV